MLLGLTLGLSISCSAYPAPHIHLATAMAATRVAETLDASKLPAAALHVELARQEIAKASAFLSEGKNEEADYMTLRAYHDAELAIALLHEATARARFEKAEEQARAAGVHSR